MALLFKGWEFIRTLRKSRRYFGVASAGYAALHGMAHVLGEASLTRLLAQATEPASGGLGAALATFAPLVGFRIWYGYIRPGPQRPVL